MVYALHEQNVVNLPSQLFFWIDVKPGKIVPVLIKSAGGIQTFCHNRDIIMDELCSMPQELQEITQILPQD